MKKIFKLLALYCLLTTFFSSYLHSKIEKYDFDFFHEIDTKENREGLVNNYISNYLESKEYLTDSFFEIRSISYENNTGQIRGYITLNNGYQFIFSPGVEEEYLLADLENYFCSGKKIIIGISYYTPKYILSSLDEPDGVRNSENTFIHNLCFSLSKETIKMLPSIQKIEEISTGWLFSSSLFYIYLSDGTRWECNEYPAKKWKIGQRVLFTEDVSHQRQTRLINIETINKEHVLNQQFNYYNDYRMAIATSATE